MRRWVMGLIKDFKQGFHGAFFPIMLVLVSGIVPGWMMTLAVLSSILSIWGVFLIPNGLQKFFQLASVKPYSTTLRTGIQFDSRPLDNQHAYVAVGTQ